MTDTTATMSRFRAARRALGVSQRELAARSGFTREEVCMWELGRRQIKLWQFEVLCTALGVTLGMTLE